MMGANIGQMRFFFSSFGGIARNFLASIILLFCSLGFFDIPGESRALDSRLARAWRQFELFLDAMQLHVNTLRSFTKKKLHFGAGGTFPWLGCKGGDTVVLLKWIRLLTQQFRLRGVAQENTKVLNFAEEAAAGGLAWTQGIFGHGVFLQPSCALHLRKSLQQFLRGYVSLAQYCIQRKMPLFGLVPKLHALAHFRRDLDTALLRGDSLVFNAAVFDNSMAEDFIGRVARQSRRIGFKSKLFERHLLQRYLLKTRFVITHFRKAKK